MNLFSLFVSDTAVFCFCAVYLLPFLSIPFLQCRTSLVIFHFSFSFSPGLPFTNFANWSEPNQHRFKMHFSISRLSSLKFITSLVNAGFVNFTRFMLLSGSQHFGCKILGKLKAKFTKCYFSNDFHLLPLVVVKRVLFSIHSTLWLWIQNSTSQSTIILFTGRIIRVPFSNKLSKYAQMRSPAVFRELDFVEWIILSFL